MKKLALLCLVIAFASCSNEKPKAVSAGIFLEDQVKEFIELNPDWTKDEAKEKEVTEKFKHKLINLSNEADFLKNMPMKLEMIKDTIISEQATKLAIFKAYGDTSRNKSSLLNYMQLQIAGIVSDAQLAKLPINKNYTLTGTLYKQGKRADVKFIHVAEFNGYDLGKYTFLITGFKPL
ncbi:hypothetical protein [Pedobacter sp. Hv1]|uniref:hypothetical protein n=1 Tax=Pedobacter sp. Hv1 TaxID=1740090 RepID=UPI0006D8CBA1|nr:hypothetical protein [Pedobacter sp. Hv1]KQC02292.1 hypothetical protein AQF98_01570 [Pedobacter sp. Hv1]